jgi:hypothetical protein
MKRKSEEDNHEGCIICKEALPEMQSGKTPRPRVCDLREPEAQAEARVGNCEF